MWKGLKLDKTVFLKMFKTFESSRRNDTYKHYLFKGGIVHFFPRGLECLECIIFLERSITQKRLTRCLGNLAAQDLGIWFVAVIKSYAGFNSPICQAFSLSTQVIALTAGGDTWDNFQSCARYTESQGTWRLVGFCQNSNLMRGLGKPHLPGWQFPHV